MPPPQPFTPANKGVGSPPSTAWSDLGNAIQDATSAATKGVNGLATALGGLAKQSAAAAAAIALPMVALESGIAAVNVGIARFVKLANPGVFQRFQLAIDDLYASIGRALTPVLVKLTEVFRSIGSVIFSLSGNGQKVIAAVAAATVGLVTFGAVTITLATILGTGAAAMVAFGAAAEVVIAVFTGGIGPIVTAIGGALAGALASLIPVVSGVASAIAGFALVAGKLDGFINKVSDAFSDLMGVLGEALSEFTKTDVIGPVLKAVGDVFKDVAQVLGAVIKAVAPGLAAMVSSLAPLIPTLVKVGAAIAAVVLVANPLGLVLTAIAATAFVVVKAFELLRPAFEEIANLVKTVFDEVVSLFVDLGKSILDSLGFDTALGEFTKSIREVGITIAAVARVITEAMRSVFAYIRSLLGLGPRAIDTADEGKRPPTNFGAAARSVSTGSVEDVLRKARESAFALGSGGGKKPEEETAKNTAAINAAIQNQAAQVSAILTAITNFPDMVAKDLTDTAHAIVDGIGNFITGGVTAVVSAIPGAQTATKVAGKVAGGLQDIFNGPEGSPLGDAIRQQMANLKGVVAP